ncbi:MAG: Sapep family Mn(2+)-dependent dipeptidase [Bacilli bacterium]|nr:Sapep family Mn(2+)-dependent dipeptidase [Bacilli bacterium]
MAKGTIFSKITSNYKDELIQKIKDWCLINSQYDDATKDEENPFGKGVSDGLKFFYDLAESKGFKVTNYDNYLVEASIGEGDKNITIMAHADVVPEGTGWDQNPFVVEERKGILTGRGVADDKGPGLACFYALLALKEAHMLGNYKIRFLVGGNEERGSLCMEHYFHTLKMPQPTYGFSPDSAFPLIFAEKGIFNFEARKKLNIRGLVSIHGGFASNAVIEKCTVKFELNDSIIPFVVTHYPEASIITNEDVVGITFTGLAAHGSMPELGKNAGMMALDFLASYTKDQDLIKCVSCLRDLNGKGVNAYGYSKEMGKNTLNVGLINYTQGEELSIIVNFRFVNGLDEKVLKANIKEALLPFNVKCSVSSPLLFYRKNHPLIKALMKAYKEETGDNEAVPLSTGGGTYAKEADNVVAFGMEFMDRDPKMHAVGENVSIQDLMDAMAIYAHGIYQLGKLIDEN